MELKQKEDNDQADKCHNNSEFHTGRYDIAVLCRISEPGNNYLYIAKSRKSFMFNFLRINRKDRGHTSRKEHAGQRYYERLYFKVTYQESVYQTESQSYSECQKYRNKNVSAFVKIQYTAHYNEGSYRADADIDAARYHYYRKSAGYDDKAGIVV